METKHTPTPWKWEIDSDENHTPIILYAPNADSIYKSTVLKCGSIDKANADFVVRACNAHDDLLFAAEFALKQIKKLATGDIVAAVIELESAIKKARGEA